MPQENAPTPDKLTERLLGFELLQDVPRDQLHWLATKGHIRKLEPGERLFCKGDPIDTMYIVLSGKIQFKLEQQGAYRVMNELVEGDISGALPYSRAKTAIALGEAQGEASVLALPKDLFYEMVREQEELTEALVHVMTSRVRDYTRDQQQTEKLAALGRLSAGLHHELNNPAAAALRAAIELKEQLGAAPEKFKAIMQLSLSPEQVDQITELLFNTLNKKEEDSLSMMERSSLEDEIIQWLDEHGIEDAYAQAETFTQHHFGLEALQKLEKICGKEQAGPPADWIYNVLVTEKLVSDIQESTRRISTLVGAVKSYSHMDRSPERELTDLAASIRNTLTILNFKLKKKKIDVTVDAPPDLPQACVFAGELNQVWTNLIDNATDAMEKGGKLEIALRHKEDNIEITISDNGSGIAEDIQDRIFDPFFTTKAIGQGTGMGLDIAKKIIDRHGGSIRLSSEPGNTTFTISIPENPIS